jgi:hypothetical protein
LLLDDDTIRRWHALLIEDGLEGLTRFEAGGSACQMNGEQQKNLKAWVAAALPRSTRQIGAWIEKEFGHVYADSAYRSAAIEAKLKARGLRSRIHQRASRNHALSKAQENANHQKSKIRARIEHVFGAQQTSPGGRIVRTIGIVRAKAKIGLQNLAYNIRRLVTLERMATA